MTGCKDATEASRGGGYATSTLVLELSSRDPAAGTASSDSGHSSSTSSLMRQGDVEDHTPVRVACSLVLILFLACSFGYGLFLMELDVTNTIFWLSMTISTVGYGAIHRPDTEQRIATICYMWLTVVVVGAC